MLKSVDVGCMVDEILAGVGGTELMGVKIKKRGGKLYVFVNFHGRRKAKCVAAAAKWRERSSANSRHRLALGDLGFFAARCESPDVQRIRHPLDARARKSALQAVYDSRIYAAC